MELVWACVMQMTNLGHMVAHLEYSEFNNIRTWLGTNC